MLAVVLSLVAGMLTVLAPCVLPLLPVIVGGSVSGADRRRPYVIAASLIASLLVFTLLLKATTLLIDVDPAVWGYISGGIVIALGLTMLFPGVWPAVAARLGVERRSQAALAKANSGERGMASAVFTGAALGPVFSSCSPTYAWVIATVLPASPARGLLYLSVYCVGVAISLLGIGLLGRRFLGRISWFSNPRGWFQRALAVLFIVVGLSLITGWDKQAQAWLAERVPTAITAVEEALVPGAEANTGSAAGVLNTDPYPAPELAGIEDWINSDPLTLAELRGKVVLIDFWTYSCINCQRTQPYLNAWYERYADDGLVIIGVHAPEFAFEKVPANVEAAVADAGIEYPVALDNSFETWQGFNNRYWPAKYLIDAEGNVRYTHFGEGEYDTTEAAIRELLAAGGSAAEVDQSQVTTNTPGQSPETYLGTARSVGYVGDVEMLPGLSTFVPATTLAPNEWTLGGDWRVGSEAITATSNATLDFKFNGQDVYLVLDGPIGSTVSVSLDDGTTPGGGDVADGLVTIDGPRLYHLVSLPDPASAMVLHLEVDDEVSANAFTFG